MILTLSLMAVVQITTESFCYIILFSHIFYYDNRVAIRVVKRDVVRQRNRSNVISMAGLFATWLMELAYFIWLALFFKWNYSDHVRELLTIIKMAEFVIIPLVQVVTSPPLKNFVFEE